MGLTTRKNEPFATVTKSSEIQGDDVVFIKGGSTVIGDKWIQFDDLRIDLSDLIDGWISAKATRVFNKKNGILYVLVTLDQNHLLEVVPSVSLNQTGLGKITTFEDLSGKLPLILVRLEQDGSTNLSSYKKIVSSMIEVYKGYGNFTLRGASGLTGPIGDTGYFGLDGIAGAIGDEGSPGLVGYPGATGPEGLPGLRGALGLNGDLIPRLVLEREAPPIADFVGVPREGVKPLLVQFTNLSSGTWETIHWDFGDGYSSSEENPLHIYTESGVYTVALYLQMMDWDSEEIKYDYIVVTSPSCYIQNVVDPNEPNGGWQGVLDSSEDTIQNVLGPCS